MEDQEHEHNHNNESENAHEITCNCGHHHEDDDGESILNCSCGHHHHHHENDEGESILNCSCGHHHNHTHNHDDNVHSVGLNSILKVKLNNSIFAIVLLIAGLIYKVIYPEQEQMSQVILAIASVIVAIPVFWSGLIGLFSKESKFMTEQLVSLAILAAMMQKDFIVATVIPIILVFGHFLEEKSIMGIEEAIASLKKLNSKDAIILKDGKESHVELNTLKLDDIVVCYPGEIIAADGTIIEGDSSINQAPITGESLPIDAYPGTKVFAGTINLSGKLLIKVTAISANSVFNKIVTMLKEAEKSKAPIVKIIEKYLDLYFPFVIMIAAITLFVTSDINRAVAILVLSCPCALVLASPTAMIAALVNASKYGIMIKNTAFLEILADIDTMVFDKTGTVTFGKLEIEKINPQPGIEINDLLEKASICASGSHHPVSTAIIDYMHNHNINISVHTGQQEIHGMGVKTESNGIKYYLGRLSWICEDSGQKEVESLNSGNSISVWVATDKQILGQLFFSDKPRPEMREALNNVRKLGVKHFVLLTGDKKQIGDEIGSKLGFDEVISECIPQDKLDYINKKKDEKHKVMFVGDGINDALALKASDCGVAIAHGGSDIAIQNADIALNGHHMSNLPQMFILSNKTRSIINQNILIGTSFSIFMMLLASAGFVTPIYGAILHNLGSVFVVLNSARLLKGPEKAA
ncbi:MAG: cation-translocating P-type ATPase [Candidatus Riflebacteria bacterium]|nr:cation-translocating P-type ATPase [Candidatus Riflebacteria bacterium]